MEKGLVGNGEGKKEKLLVIYCEWCRKPNSTQEVFKMDNRSISYTSWKCQYHIVFILKYWKKALREK